MNGIERSRIMKRWLGVVLLFSSLSLAQSFDVLIQGGRVVDGSGNPWYPADIGIRDGRIVHMGRIENASSDVVLDATGLYVTPGFIDPHTHAGSGLLEEELRGGRPLLAQGLTTVVVNPDGGGPWPLAEQRATYEEQGVGLNIALLVGQGTIRREVMGMEDRPPTAEELERMKSLVREGMEAGAFGLSTGLYYAPGNYASTDEIVALAREVAPRGIYTSHIRDEGDYNVGLIAAVEEVIAISEQAGIPGIVTHFKALGPNNWGKSVAACIRIERARQRGVQVWADQYPYEASGTSITGALVPRWAQAGETGPGEPSPLERRLQNPTERQRMRDGMLENIERRGGPSKLVVSRHQSDPSIEGRSLEELAEQRSMEPVDVALDLLDAGGAGLVSFNMSDLDIENIMSKDYTMTCSDGGLVPSGRGKPHPRYYGTFPRKIRRYVVERGVITLPHAIRSMTSLVATVHGFEGRGLLREGAWADVVVFDLERIRDRATYQDPHQLSEGMVHVLVNGKLAVRDGQFTGENAGVVLEPRDR
jgi:N-acyl-D-aspartate/D-glutamate deacylase